MTTPQRPQQPGPTAYAQPVFKDDKRVPTAYGQPIAEDAQAKKEDDCFSKEQIRVLLSFRYLPGGKSGVSVPEVTGNKVLEEVNELVKYGLVETRVANLVQKEVARAPRPVTVYSITPAGRTYADQEVLKPFIEHYKDRLYFGAKVSP